MGLHGLEKRVPVTVGIRGRTHERINITRLSRPQESFSELLSFARQFQVSDDLSCDAVHEGMYP